MIDNPSGEERSVGDEELRERILNDLTERLPVGTQFVVDVGLFAKHNVEVKVDRQCYVLSFSLHIGLHEGWYQEALGYAVDLVVDHVRRLHPPERADTPRAKTSFPDIAGFVNPRLAAVGASAHVFQAIQISSRRTVAVKVYADSTNATIATARAEAFRLAAVDHTAIPRLIDCSLEPTGGAPPHLVMEWRWGCALSDPVGLHEFFDLSYGERLAHFLTLTDAVASLHAAGTFHGDVHGGNILFDHSTNRIALIDLGHTLSNDPEEQEKTDVAGLARFFKSTVCVPPIPSYAEIMDGVSSVHELVAMLAEFPLMRIPKCRHVDESLLSVYANERYVRMSEWIHRFRQVFDIQARITFHYEPIAEPIGLKFDSSGHRVVVVCGGSYGVDDEFAGFCNVLIRTFKRNWVFVNSPRLSDASSTASYEALERGDRSQPLESGSGYSPEQLLAGLADAFSTGTSESEKVATRLAASEPDKKSIVEVTTYSQLLQASAIVDWLRITAPQRLFGELTAAQINALDKLVTDHGSFADGSVFELFRATAEWFGRGVSPDEEEVVEELKRRCTEVISWPTAAFACLVEGLVTQFSSFDQPVIYTPNAPYSHHVRAHRIGRFRFHPTTCGLTLQFSSADTGEAEFNWLIRERDAVQLAGVLSFERAARGLASESFSCGRFSVHARVGFGNILGANGHYGIVGDGEWNDLTEAAREQAIKQDGASTALKRTLRTLFEDFVYDLRKSRYDGRVGVGRGVSFEASKTLRSLGLTTLSDLSGKPDETTISSWYKGRLEAAMMRLNDE